MQDNIEFRHLESAADIAASFAVMRELRQQLQNQEDYADRVSRQQNQGYRLLAACLDGQIAGLAGYRHQENLIYGAFTYIDDLVVRAADQRSNIGEKLIEQVKREALGAGRSVLVLDTGLANALAQRFYFRQGLLARGLHFSMALENCQ